MTIIGRNGFVVDALMREGLAALWRSMRIDAHVPRVVLADSWGHVEPTPYVGVGNVVGSTVHVRKPARFL